jgi:hypothetical protein
MPQELAEDAKKKAQQSDPEQPALYWLGAALGLGTAITQLQPLVERLRKWLPSRTLSGERPAN